MSSSTTGSGRRAADVGSGNVANRWLTRPPATDTRARVFCLPPAGCGTSVFGRWPQRWSDVDLLPVELPGRLARFDEPRAEDLAGLAADLVAGLAPAMDRPYGFFGHCWSALLAFEASAQASRRGHRPDALVVSADVPPQTGPFGRMLGMSRAELAEETRAVVIAQGQAPHPQLVELYAGILAHDIELRVGYRPQPPVRIETPVTAVRWSDDPEYREAELAGWSDCGPCSFHVLDGAHDEFMTAPEPLLDLVARSVSAAHG